MFKLVFLAFLLIGKVFGGEVRFCKDFQHYAKYPLNPCKQDEEINPTKIYLGYIIKSYYNTYPVIFLHLDELYIECLHKELGEDGFQSYGYLEMASTSTLLSGYSGVYFMEADRGTGSLQEILLTNAKVTDNGMVITGLSHKDSPVQVRIVLHTVAGIYKDMAYKGINLILSQLEKIKAVDILNICAAITKLAKETTAFSSKGVLGAASSALKTASQGIATGALATGTLGVISNFAYDLAGSAGSAIFGLDPGKWSAITTLLEIATDLDSLDDLDDKSDGAKQKYSNLPMKAKKGIGLMKSMFMSYACSLTQSYYEGSTISRAANG